MGYLYLIVNTESFAQDFRQVLIAIARFKALRIAFAREPDSENIPVQANRKAVGKQYPCDLSMHFHIIKHITPTNRYEFQIKVCLIRLIQLI